MRILRLHVENFGTLHDFSLELEKGINILYHENGWGKSTLSVFIKAMLYGLPATTKRSLDENERKKYTPWQGGAFGGSIEFESEKGRFRAERFFGARESADTFALYDLDTKLESDAYTASLGVELFGIDADGYERTVYISQRGIPSKGENYSITAKLGDLLDDVDDIGGFDSAAEALDKRCKYYVTTGNRGRIAVLEAELAEREREKEALLRVRATLEARERELAEVTREAKELTQKQERIRAELRRAGEARARVALVSERDRLQKDLEALKLRRDTLEEKLGGLHPDEETLHNAAQAGMRLRELSVRLREIPEEKSVVTELLPAAPGKALPVEEDVRKLSNANETLRSLSGRMSALDMGNATDARFARFSNGVPREEEISDCFAILEGRNRTTSASKGRFFVGLTFAGAVASVLLLVLVIALGGNALCIVGLVASLLALCIGVGGILVCGKSKRIEEESLLRVRRLLQRYGMNTEGEWYRELTQLSLLKEEYVKQKNERESLVRERERVERDWRAQISLIKNGFSELGIELSQKNDYSEEIRALERDVALLRRTRAEMKALRERRRATVEEIAKYRRCLEDLLPRIGIREGQEVLSTVDAVGRLETEYRLIDSQIKERGAALEKFNAEHPTLSDTHDREGDTLDYDALSNEDQHLSSEVSILSEKQALLKSQIERLCGETDRIEEVEASLASTEESLLEARENSATVARTLKFLEEAKVGLSTRYLDGMQKSLGKYLSALRPDAEDAVMDASFEVSLRAGGKTRDTEYFSRGWRDVIQFCTRLSLMDALYDGGEKPCLVLDDPFVNLDDTRLRAARELIERISSEYQIVYMVCHTGRE